MTIRKALADKILILGIDGMDPSLTRKFLAAGELPNIQKFIDRGAQREDLTMLGCVPTITPPMWTTMATGAYPKTHGITCFWNNSHEELDTIVYAFDSRKCKAEPLWNAFAEAGKKTMVFHWPGSAWPPTSDNPNLHVVDGTQPTSIQMGIAAVDWEKMVIASEEFSEVAYKARAVSDNGAGCILTDLEDSVVEEGAVIDDIMSGGGESKSVQNVMLTHEDGELSLDKIAYDVVNSPIKPASGWANAPIDAKEFTLLTSNGFVRRPCLILKNDAGIYDRIAIYKSKKDEDPLLVAPKDVMMFDLIDDVLVNDEHKKANRHLRLLDLAEDGSSLRLWISIATDITVNSLFHPQHIHGELVENVGYIPMLSIIGGADINNVEKLALPCWHHYTKWQAKALKYLIDVQNYDIIFSHVHNVDSCGHLFWYLCKEREGRDNDEVRYQKGMLEIYKQTDEYLGEFLPYLDKGWTVIIMSDHGLLTTDEAHQPLIGDAFGCNVKVLQELGYCTLKTDANGNELPEIDWEHTQAVAPRGGHIYLNLKGRTKHGIVDPADQYELERRIITDLYNYKIDGKRVIALALRNKDGAILGIGGEESGDILYFLEEGFNRIHGDSLSTAEGYYDTTVGPIFIAAGKGLKEGFKTDRVIKQIDFAPTIAALGGVRMPAQCEGAPVYQIFAEEF